ncbi:mevalonate kinase family protein [Lignipirellula cremea]|uniref:D-glycero-alpha-D-manno-heptose 7-phosphate kinase n=1 Tax=Lignipirellula cremea TaxID=2528010 RepID=A0A518DYH2_9BACT|nr:GHMP kinase [Lignipirellula cremea]QDU96851.1 D-glycero-alpha-D-manno-heptose 7-phosphate kinase [Lignipirellula cremea]
MEIIRRRAYARAGLVGNPSDGYFGKTLSVIVRDYFAEVVLYEWEEIEVLLTDEDRNRFATIDDLARDVKLHGYYGGIRLIKAAIHRFVEYCRQQETPLHDRKFSIRYRTNIPRAVGLAGSSAIVVATLRGLLAFYQVDMPLAVQASWVLGVENELGIAAGLQDRVIQVYEGLVFMDFAQEQMQTLNGFRVGQYQSMDPALLPPLYLAYSTTAGEPTEVFHNNLRARFEAGEPSVLAAMEGFAGLADEAREALLRGDHAAFEQTLNANFDLRRRICQLPADQIAMVETARSVGASAKFAGSGGAIVGVCADPQKFQRLQHAMAQIDCLVWRPAIILEPPVEFDNRYD